MIVIMVEPPRYISEVRLLAAEARMIDRLAPGMRRRLQKRMGDGLVTTSEITDDADRAQGYRRWRFRWWPK